MAKEQEIKYDGSIEEMMRLGLVDESGSMNPKRRNEFNQYMATVWEKEHPNEKSPYAEKFPTEDQTKEYFEEREKKQAERKIKRKSFWDKLMGRNK